MTSISDLPEVVVRARRRIAYRLIPFLFLIYVVNYIDRVTVSFANLRMSADLGFSDRVYGLGIGMFYLTYVLFEIPRTVIVERWSARKWIARFMISWGVVTILTGFIHSAGQFYVARFFLGFLVHGQRRKPNVDPVEIGNDLKRQIRGMILIHSFPIVLASTDTATVFGSLLMIPLV